MLRVLAEQAAAARAVLSNDVVDYFACGAGDELSRDEAADGWLRFRLRPWPLRNVASVDTTLALLGVELPTPVLVAPTAFHQLAHPDGERASAAGAAAAGSLYVLSTRASLPIAEVAAATPGPWWFQVYIMRDRNVTAGLVDDAVAAGATALVLTGDTPYIGRKRGVDAVRIPLRDDSLLINAGNHLRAGADAAAALEQDPSAGLETITWLQRRTGLPVLVKGVLRGDAAVDCLDAGAAGVIVSNHGGRQLDRAVATAIALEEVVAAVADRGPVLVDGGVRSGLDVLIALALGASAVLVGRPVLWALAAGGVEGVRDALTALTDDLAHSMALAGVANLRSVTRDLITNV